MRRLSQLAAEGPLPTSVTNLLADRHPDLRAKLILNPYLTVDSARHLFALRPSVAAVERLVKGTDRVELIEALTASGDTRPKVVAAIIENWALGSPAQAALAAWDLPSEAAGKLLTAKWLDPKVGATLIGRAGPYEQIRWLVANEARLDDETLWSRLESACSGEWMAHPATAKIVTILYRRPALRHRAATSGLAQLVVAAAAVHLDPADQEAVLAAWADAGADKRWQPAGLNLLDRTSTTAAHREVAFRLLVRSGGKEALVSCQVPAERSPYPTGVALADIAERDVLELLLLRGGGNHSYGLARGVQWHELAGSPHLDAELTERLAAHIGQSELAGRSVIDELSRRFPTADIPDRLKAEWNAHLRPAANTVPAETQRKTARTGRYAWRNPAGWTSSDPHVEVITYKGVAFDGSPYSAGRFLADKLGDDLVAWEVCFSLLETFEGKTSELASLSKASVQR